ncbi:MAG: MFS transporter, partial [Isosphaeraceae bacterium]
MLAERQITKGSPPGKHPLVGLLISQALGAFNDNAWKQIVVLLAMASAASATDSQEKAAFAQVILLIPLIIFNLPGGALADRLSKRSVLLAMKALELVLMLLGTAVLLLNPAGGFPALLILGLLGVQAALFSPSKYGILPEIVPHEKLSSGNGLMEMWTNLAIIGGTVAGGIIVYVTGARTWLGGMLLAAVSAMGLIAALGIPRVPAARSEGGLAETFKLAWSAVRADRILRLAILGQVIVWSIASLVPAPVLAYAMKTLELPEWMSGFPLAAVGIGIGAGSLAAGRLSASKVEYGLVPLGALGLTLSTLAFALIGPGLAGTILLMGLVGFSAGFVFVPLSALIQWRSPEDRRGAVIALGNMLVDVGMLAGSILAMVLAVGGFSARGTFLGASAVLAVATLWALWLAPDALLRFLLILLASTLYKLRVLGRSNVPDHGPALLTPNHVSFVDGLFVMGTIDRPIRFVVYAEYFKRPLLGRFLRTMGAIPIAGHGGLRMILEAFREAGRALDNGELVCIFPEGQITRTGMTLPFQRGMERIVKGRDVPIIPVHLDRATSSVFSPMQRRWLPERIPLPVTVSFGAPLPSTTSAAEIRQAIAELDQRAWEHRKEDRRPLHHEFIRQARRHPFRLAMADLISGELSCIKALAGAIALARALRTRWQGQDAVGIMLPTSVGGVLVNLAAAVSGRVVVNLNFTAGKAAMSSAAAQAGLRTLVTSRNFVEKASLE